MTSLVDRDFKTLREAKGTLLALGAKHRTARGNEIFTFDTLTLAVPVGATNGKAFQEYKPLLREFIRGALFGASAAQRPEPVAAPPPPAAANGHGQPAEEPRRSKRSETAPPPSRREATRHEVDATRLEAGEQWETATWPEMLTAMSSGKCISRMVYVTPEIANYIISNFNTHNRDLRESAIKVYAQDMRNRAWGISHQGVAFSTPQPNVHKPGARPEPVLLDGQHRLYALDEVKQTVAGVWMPVFVNMPPGSQAFVDQGRVRKPLDVIRLEDDEGKNATAYQMAISRRALMGVRSQVPLSRGDQTAFFRANAEAVRFVTDDAFHKRKMVHVMPAPVGAVLVRAYYHCDPADLRIIAGLLLDGFSTEDRHRPVIMLRDWLLKGAHERTEANQRISREVMIYMKTQRAVVAYLNHENIKILYPMREEAFMLPGEAPHRATAGQSYGPREVAS